MRSLFLLAPLALSACVSPVAGDWWVSSEMGSRDRAEGAECQGSFVIEESAGSRLRIRDTELGPFALVNDRPFRADLTASGMTLVRDHRWGNAEGVSVRDEFNLEIDGDTLSGTRTWDFTADCRIPFTVTGGRL